MIGQKVYFDWQGNHATLEVIGVAEDYNQTSLKDAIVPIVFQIAEQADQYNFLVASVNPSGFSNTLAEIEKIWQSQVTDAPFEYSFLDEDIQQQYNDDERVSMIMNTIWPACGLCQIYWL